MNKVTTIGIDLAKTVFQLHGVDAEGRAVLRRQSRRSQMLEFFPRMWPGQIRWKSLCEYPRWAAQSTTAKAPNRQGQLHLPAMRRKIGRLALISAMQVA